MKLGVSGIDGGIACLRGAVLQALMGRKKTEYLLPSGQVK